MIKKIDLCFGACLLSLSSFALAAATPASYQMPSGVFVGAGGSFNSVSLSQRVNMSATGAVADDGTIVAAGAGSARLAPFYNTQTTFAPVVQAGYFQVFPNNCDWIWGAKFSYQYLGVNVTDRNLTPTQSVTLIPTDDDTFFQNMLIGSAQTSVNHQLNFLAFIARHFDKTEVYFGLGPVLFGTQSNIYQAIGSTSVEGIRLDFSGTGSNFSNTRWVWGGAVQVGATYHVYPTWFFDFNYTYAQSAPFTINNSGTFSSTLLTFLNAGSINVNTTKRVIAQAATITINKQFEI